MAPKTETKIKKRGWIKKSRRRLNKPISTMNSTLCHGVTLKGVSCSKRTKDPSQLCHLHRNKPAKPEPAPEQPPVAQEKAKTKDDFDPKKVDKDECCVCYESMPVKDALECKHLVCKECLKKMRDDRCPMCRQPIKSLSSKSIREIQRRRTQDRNDRILDATQAFLRSNPVDPYLNLNPRIPIHLMTIFSQVNPYGTGVFINPYGI